MKWSLADGTNDWALTLLLNGKADNAGDLNDFLFAYREGNRLKRSTLRSVERECEVGKKADGEADEKESHGKGTTQSSRQEEGGEGSG